MAKETGNYLAIRRDIISTVDPTVTPVVAAKGTLYRYVPPVGNPVMYIKKDDGLSTNFQFVGNSEVLLNGAVDPRIAPGVAANDGSLYVDTVGMKFYQKTGPLDTDWTQFDEGDSYFIAIAVDPRLGAGVAAPIGTVATDTTSGNLYHKTGALDTDWTLFDEGDAFFITVTVDPSAGAGLAAPIGTVATDIVSGLVYHKTGALDTDWTQFDNTVADNFIISTVVDPGAGAGTPAALGTIAIDTVTGFIYHKSGALDTDWTQFDDTVADNFIISTVVDPGAGAGTPAALGTIAIDTVTGFIYHKSGALDTEWTQFDNTVADNFIISTVVDPGAGAGTPAALGTIAINTATGLIYRKSGALDTAWTLIGAPPTGTANTVAYFNTLGGLSSSNVFGYDEVLRAIRVKQTGGAPGTGDVLATGNASFARGLIDTNGVITASGVGSSAIGSAASDGQLISSGEGSICIGNAIGNNGANTCTLRATNIGSVAIGQVVTTGTNSDLSAIGIGSFAFGLCDNSLIQAGGTGSLAFGMADINSQINAFGNGSFVFGKSTGINSSIGTGGNGSFAGGFAENGGIINSSAGGSFAFGHADQPSFISASGPGGSFAGGHTISGSIVVGGQASLAWGSGLTVDGNFSACFGVGHSCPLDFTFAAGHTNNPVSTSLTATNRFMVGNGDIAGSPNNAFEVRSDGSHKSDGVKTYKITRYGASQVLTTRDPFVIIGPGTASDETFTLPAAEDGTVFRIYNHSPFTQNIGVSGVETIGGVPAPHIMGVGEKIELIYDVDFNDWFIATQI